MYSNVGVSICETVPLILIFQNNKCFKFVFSFLQFTFGFDQIMKKRLVTLSVYDGLGSLPGPPFSGQSGAG